MARLLVMAGFGLGLIVAYLGAGIVYNLFLHPLRKYPGPLVLRATRLGYVYKHMGGTLPFDMLDLHKRYGDIVRIAPGELAFANPQAWKDIMGHRGAGAGEFEKDVRFYRPIPSMPVDIVSAPRQEHGMLRKTMANGFSDRTLRQQEPIIKGYIDLLMQRLTERSGEGKEAVNLASWYNFTTFDVIGDLAFGEAFGCLSNSDYHPWVKTIFEMARAGVFLQACGYVPGLTNALLKLVPKHVIEEQQKHQDMTDLKLRKRMEMGHERPDFIEGLLKKKDDWGLTMDKLRGNASILIIGGSETTATLLSGVTYFLLTTPTALERISTEVRDTFEDEDDINFTSVNNLPFLLACLDEGLRMYPPVPTGLPRIVPKGGATICNEFVPEKMIVSIHQWAMYHNPKHWTKPFEFHPERWLGDPEFASDNRESFQPFHVGARSCLGRNLAYLEAKTILARVLWNFDLRIADESRDWLKKQRIWNMWEKGPLNTYLTPVTR